MENVTLLMIAVIGLYALFKAVTSALELGFKIAIGFMILSFLGYSFAGWEEINPPTMQEPMIEANATADYAAQQPAEIAAAPEKPIENTKYL